MYLFMEIDTYCF